MTALINHLNKTPYNLSRLAREAGVNVQMLHDAIKGRKPLPASAAWDMIWHLAPVIIDGWKFSRDEQIHALFVERKYEGGGQETIDHGNHFEYRISVARHMLSDEFELINFFS